MSAERSPSGPIISVDELATLLGAADVRVVDVRWYLKKPGQGRRAYEDGHVPGAIFLDLDEDLSGRGDGRHPLPSPAEFARRLGGAGIGSDHLVVAYDDGGGTTAARLWWMLDNLGHERVAVLDGGIQAWTAAGHPLVTEVPAYAPAVMRLRDEWRGVITRADLSARLGAVTLLDARAPERYRGEVEPIDPAAGHIPTALSAPTSGNLDESGRFRPPGELRRRFADVGAHAGEVVTYCGSGTSACHNSLAMRVAGLPEPILYVGSFSDWSTAGMPVATGAEAGDPPSRAG